MKTIIEEINIKDLICLDEIIQLVSRQFNTTATNYLGEKIKLIFNLTNLNPYISEGIDEMSLVNLKDEILCLNQEIYSSGKVEFVLKIDPIIELKGFIPIDEQKENMIRHIDDSLANAQEILDEHKELRDSAETRIFLKKFKNYKAFENYEELLKENKIPSEIIESILDLFDDVLDEFEDSYELVTKMDKLIFTRIREWGIISDDDLDQDEDVTLFEWKPFNGVGIDFYENRRKRSVAYYKNGKYNGLCTHWYEHGQKECEVNYKDDKRNGLCTEWHKFGQKKTEGYFKDGKKEDLQTEWDENGKMTFQGTFIDGKEQQILGFMYYKGKGVTQDYKEAVKWYRLSAEQGYAIAQFNLGLMYYEGQGVPQDHKEAFKWYRLAAEQGLAEAQYNLGFMYSDGQGVPQDYNEAVKWYRLSAERGYASAQYNLGLMYYEGQGVPQDYNEAVKWYRLSAEQGDAEAQNYLGMVYYQGQGVTQDYVLAHMWANLGASNGSKDAIKGRNIVEKKMTPQQIEKAKEMARNWKPKK